MKGIEHSKFNAESSIAAEIEKLDFPLSAEVSGKETVSAFREIEAIYRSLEKSVSSFTRDGVELLLLNPASSTKTLKKFEIVSETSLKEKRKVSLDMTVEAKFRNEPDFWNRGLLVSELVDMLEDFCDSQNREKGRSVFLDRALIPTEEDKT